MKNMTNMIGMLRVKNEERWLETVIRSMQPLCDPIYVFDDHSTDATRDIALGLDCVVMPSPFEGLDDLRDKNYMLEQLHQDRHADGTWVLAIDGDEELEEGGQEKLIRLTETTPHESLGLRVLYLWDSPDQIRTDGVYKTFSRPSAFRWREGLQLVPKLHGGDFHCGNVPTRSLEKYGRSEISLLHYGYMDRADRIRKYGWYNANDPNNDYEDQYRHIVIGDLFPAESSFKHGGPLKLEPVRRTAKVSAPEILRVGP